MTYQEKFDHLKKTYGDKADFSAVTENIAAQIVMTDDDCHGIFYVTYLNGVAAVEPYDYRDRTVNVIINSVLLEDLLKGKKDPVQEYLNGSFTLEGNTEHALALIGALKKKPAKRAPRKTAEKKAEPEKKTAEKKAEPAKKAAKKA